MKIKSRLENLTHHINLWTALNGKQHVAASLVEVIENSDYKDVLAAEGITFARSNDVFKDARVNAQKFFRWLGSYDGIETHKEHLFDIEAVIVQAMPEHIRISYLTSVYSPAGVMVSPKCVTETTTVDLTRVMQLIVKEDAEALTALMVLSSNRDQAHPSALESAEKELTESIAIKTATLDAIKIEIGKKSRAA